MDQTPAPRAPDAGQNQAKALPRLQQRYLLSALIPYHRDPAGGIWLGRLWAHDLRAHLDYISDLTVLAPEIAIERPGPDMEQVVPPPGTRLRFRPWGRGEVSGRGALLSLPARAVTAWKAVGEADLVHSGVAGWPIPPGVLLNPVALIRRRPLIMVVESAFWRIPDPAAASRKSRLRAGLSEAFARWSLRHARLGIYTSKAYLDSLPTGPRGEGIVLPASWIEDDMILGQETALAAWQAKAARPVRFLMASRLVAQKGIGLLLEALSLLESQGSPVEIDVIGEGPMRADLAEFAARAQHVRLRLLEPVEYGAPFMALLRDYHAVIVPTTGDEQPRILYDAFSQGVPVIATATDGNREVVEDGRNGRLPAAGSARALAGAMRDMAGQGAMLQAMGMTALETARQYTHQTMHARRAIVLHRIFGSGSPGQR